MMRSLYSGVSGLKTHQTKMDVIGNNIANVNTVAYKSQSITFSDLMYQTTQSASGPNATTGAGGINARQIGLGVKSAAINTAITTAGSSQTTGNPFDLKINGDAFFIVSNGVENFFTRDGSFYVDAAGNLAMTSNGYNVMGWQVDEETGQVKQDTVSALRIMSTANLTYPPEATTEAYISGLCDKNDTDINSTSGKTMNLNFYDALGYSYTAKLSVHATGDEATYYVQLDDILDSNGVSLKEIYDVENISSIATLGGSINVNSNDAASVDTNVVTINYAQATVKSKGYATGDVKEIPAGITKPTTTPPITHAILDTDNVTVKYFTSGMGEDSVLFSVDGTPVSSGKVESYTITDNSTNPAGVKDVKVEQLKTMQLGGTGTPSDLDTIFGKSLQGLYGDNYQTVVKAFEIDPDTGKLLVTNKTVQGSKLIYDASNGNFDNIDGGDSIVLNFEDMIGNLTLKNFSDITVDFSGTSQQNNGGTATLGADPGTKASNGALGCGRKLGEMTGVSITQNGEIYASYDNGMSRLLGQIAVATFANASGLEKQGDNLYSSTQNSGEFDGIGQDITADGTGSISTGVLEMSNVDLSSEFTEMITTQRGFQANSRIITVSDTLLEELTNLKR
ncbi:MAG: flagellar hook-basal body complex protein [Lachnospiraceae bacterium]|nr:flagellar hook-basal body complex protein [Lachnospiraceae bacterium]